MASFVNEKTFELHEIGENSKQTFTGTFTAFRFLSARRILLKDQLLRKNLAGDNPLISGQVPLASKLAVVQSGLKEAPEWWGQYAAGDDIIDMNIIDKVYEEVNKIQTDAENGVTESAASVAAELPKAAAKAAEKEAEQK